MLIKQTLDKLEVLGLFGMVLGLREQLESSQYQSLRLTSDSVCSSAAKLKLATAAAWLHG